MKFPWFKKKEPVPMKIEFQQMKESGILVIQQEAEDRYWDNYIEDQAQEGFEEQINAKVLDMGGGRKIRMPILFIPDLPSKSYYTVYDYETPTGRYMHKDPRSLIGKRMHELLIEYDNKKPLE